MRLDTLRIRNVNSLYGEWNIDFGADAFRNGIFAIAGATGSGKTTILDAIMLALFAETPRLSGTSRIECVSKHAGSCLVDLGFSLGGDSYHARWGFRSYRVTKSNPRPRLNENSMFHELVRNGAYLTEKPSETARTVAGLLGMNARQFCQTVMLAQGRFNEFLLADDKDKAAILEKLTATTRYADIGREVYVRLKGREEELRGLQGRMEAMHLLGEEEEREKRRALEELSTAMKGRIARREELSALLELVGNLSRLREMLARNGEALQALGEEERAFLPDAARLELGLRAARLEEAFRRREELARDCAREEEGLRRLREEALPALETRAAAAGKEAAEGQAALAAGKAEGEALEELFARVTPLDQEIHAQERELRAAEAIGDELAGKARRTEDDLNELRGRLERLQLEGRQAEAYLQGHRQDEGLPGKQAEWGERLKKLAECRARLDGRDRELAALGRRLAGAADAERKAGEALDAVRKRQEALAKAVEEKEARAKDILDGSRPEDLERQQELLERTIQAGILIRSYEEVRRSLRKGEACPLCGSLEHPYAQDGPPEFSRDEAELKRLKGRLKAWRSAQERLGRARTEVDAGRLEAARAEAGREQRRAESAHLRAEAERLEEERRGLQAEAERLAQDLRRDLAGFGIKWDGGGGLPEEVAGRLKAWRVQSDRSNAFGRSWAELQAREEGLLAQRSQLERDRKAQAGRSQALRERLAAGRSDRRGLFGDRQVDAERQALRRRLDGLQRRAGRAQERQVQADDDLRHRREEADSLEKSLRQRRDGLARAGLEFRQGCDREGMSEEGFRAAALPPEARQELAARRTELATRRRALEQQRAGLDEDLKGSLARLPPDCDPEGARAELDQLNARLGDDNVRFGELKQVLKGHEENVREAGVLRLQAEKLQGQRDLLKRMDDLIGGADGGRFKKLAQKLTLLQLLEAANRRLGAMNPRYLLVPCGEDDRRGLGIDVVDQEQGGEVRTSRNLSGGEQFMVSLALALGLSSMTGSHRQVDFLFLDEGFGTLSDEPLEQAVGMLAQLRQQEGKTIGIISHVPVIGELFPSILVEKIGEGRSRLQGPGVTGGSQT